MLAKQVWKLQTEQTSLPYKVFSKKYFPTDSVFEAKSKQGYSLGKASLKQGMLSRKGCCGEWVMGLRFGCFMTIGFLGVFQQRPYHTHKTLKMT